MKDRRAYAPPLAKPMGQPLQALPTGVVARRYGMRWRKLGLVYRPSGCQWWARGYAHLPTPELRDNGVIRVYFAALDEHKYGRIGHVDVAASDPLRVLAEGQA